MEFLFWIAIICLIIAMLALAFQILMLSENFYIFVMTTFAGYKKVSISEGQFEFMEDFDTIYKEGQPVYRYPYFKIGSVTLNENGKAEYCDAVYRKVEIK